MRVTSRYLLRHPHVAYQRELLGRGVGLTKPGLPRVPPPGCPRRRRQLCDPGQGWAASQGGSGWRTRSRPSSLTSRRVLLRLPLVTWKFSWGYNFCRVNLGKTRTAPTLLLPTTQLGRTPEHPRTYTWGGGRREWVGVGVGLDRTFQTSNPVC